MKSCVKVLFLFIAVLIASCTKQDGTPGSKVTKVIGDDNRCMSRQWTSAGVDTLSASDRTIADSLLQLSNTSYSNLRLTSIAHEIMQGTTFTRINADQYVNGLVMFNMPMTYQFNQGGLYFQNGTIVSSSSLDTIPSLRPAQVRTLFDQQLTNSSNNNTDDCMITEFGYFNTGANTGTVKLVKAWRVSFKGHDFPEAIINDDGSLLSFFDGIIVF